MIIAILIFIIESSIWLISSFPFLIPYQILLTALGKKVGYKQSIEHIVIIFIFVYYLSGVLSFTGFPSIWDIVDNRFTITTSKGLNIPPDKINLIPFRWITGGVRQYIDNILLFIPLGFMLPFIWEKYEALWKTLLSGIILSLIIELSQLLNIRITDIDDLLLNTLGALIGWAIFKLLQEHIAKLRDKVSVQSANTEKIPSFLCEEACLYMVCAFAGMFFVYNPFFVYPFLRYLYFLFTH